jgi:hypothetical protein
LSKERNLDIMDLLAAVDRGDGNWLSQQSEAAQHEFTPLVAMRWATGIKDTAEATYMLWLINHRVNAHLFDLDKDLSFRLLASCGLHRSLHHEWLRGASSSQSTTNAAYRLLAEQNPTASDGELQILLSLHSRDEFAQFVLDCGKTKDEAKVVMKAYDNLDL